MPNTPTRSPNCSTTHFLSCSVHPSLVSSRPIHTLTITLPLTFKLSLASTLTFPTLTDFLGELESHFTCLHTLSLFLRKWLLSLAACILVWCFCFFLSCALYHSAHSALWAHPSVWLGSSDPQDYLHLLFSVWKVEDFTWKEKCFVPLSSSMYTNILVKMLMPFNIVKWLVNLKNQMKTNTLFFFIPYTCT